MQIHGWSDLVGYSSSHLSCGAISLCHCCILSSCCLAFVVQNTSSRGWAPSLWREHEEPGKSFPSEVARSETGEHFFLASKTFEGRVFHGVFLFFFGTQVLPQSSFAFLLRLQILQRMRRPIRARTAGIGVPKAPRQFPAEGNVKDEDRVKSS